MKTTYIDIGDGRWGIIVNYDYNMHDWDDIWAICRSFGMPDKKARDAIRILSERNSGMCVSNDDIRMSAIFVSRATSSSEWWNTMLHEIRHAADAIIEYYGVEWDGEDAAYLTGYITKCVVEKIAEPCY